MTGFFCSPKSKYVAGQPPATRPLDLSLFFDALESSFAPENVPEDALFHLVARNEGVFPDWQQTHIALIGVPEERGTRTNLGTAGGAADIRRQFYLLKKPASTCRISDLGDLRVGIDLQETYFRVREVCETLLGQGVFPILVGGSHDLLYGQYLAYGGLDRPVSVVNVDATLDIHGRTPADKHLLDLLTHEPNYLHSFCNLAHQSYLTSADALAVLEKLSFESFRLGQIRGGIQEMEPVLREADLLGFDITAIKLSDAPGNANAHAFGLTAEEACQLCWYAGLNDKLTSAGFYEYNPGLDNRGQTAEAVATMIWYLVEGFYHRKHDLPIRDSTHVRYVVPANHPHEDLVFYKSTLSEKWWLEVPDPKRPGPMSVMPCSYQDYQQATRGELPTRWINRLGRMG